MSRETIGITDSGGRGSALVHKYSQSPDVHRIVAVPGNDLMSLNVCDGVRFDRYPEKLAAANAANIARLLHQHGVTLADICQDDMVAGGAVNELNTKCVHVIGPTKEAGQIEWSKEWARAFLQECGIPQPEFHVCHSEQEGLNFIRKHADRQWVIKANGLALGKGVYVTANSDEAEDAVKAMSTYGSAGETYLIEERLRGEEFSTYAVSDGGHFKILGSAQDHKTLLDGDKGPNTGGMGCCSNPLVLNDPHVMKQIYQVFRKTFSGLADRGHPYTGVLYLGGMLVDDQVKVIEFNARWGDPEAQVVVPGLQTDLLEISRAVVDHRIKDLHIEVDQKVRITIALASRGYPGDSLSAGKEIFGIEDARSQAGVTIYGAGAKRVDGHDFINGGRVLYVVGEGKDVNGAREVAYGAMDRIRVDDGGGHFRTDIGSRDVMRLRKN